MTVADYDITVDGELAAELEAAFAPHVVTRFRGTSTIRAKRLDDAALIALLNRVNDLALGLRRVERRA